MSQRAKRRGVRSYAVGIAMLAVLIVTTGSPLSAAQTEKLGCRGLSPASAQDCPASAFE